MTLLGQQVVDPGRVDRVEDSVRTILDNPPYRPEPNLVERFVQWLVDRGILSGGSMDAAASVIGVVVRLVVVALVVWLGWLVVRRLRTGAFRRSRVGAVETTSTGPGRSADQWLADARRAQDGGDHREAVRAAYRALVVRLVDLEAVPAPAGTTVGVHREAMTRAEVVADLQARGFSDASDVFERVWYAQAGASADDVGAVIAAAEAVGVRA